MNTNPGNYYDFNNPKDMVSIVQKALNDPKVYTWVWFTDGKFWTKTFSWVIEIQRNAKLPTNGLVDTATLKTILELLSPKNEEKGVQSWNLNTLDNIDKIIDNNTDSIQDIIMEGKIDNFINSKEYNDEIKKYAARSYLYSWMRIESTKWYNILKKLCTLAWIRIPNNKPIIKWKRKKYYTRNVKDFIVKFPWNWRSLNLYNLPGKTEIIWWKITHPWTTYMWKLNYNWFTSSKKIINRTLNHNEFNETNSILNNEERLIKLLKTEKLFNKKTWPNKYELDFDWLWDKTSLIINGDNVTLYSDKLSSWSTTLNFKKGVESVLLEIKKINSSSSSNSSYWNQTNDYDDDYDDEDYDDDYDDED